MAVRPCFRLLKSFLLQHGKRSIIIRSHVGRLSNGIRTEIASDVRRHPRQVSSANVGRELTTSCWKCGKHVGGDVREIVCGNCGAIQEISLDVNYFGLFGLSPDFELDPTELTSKFRYLQSHFHPDKFAGKSEREQEYSLSCSSLLNAAYQTLLNPVDRGLYLLSLRNTEIAESDLTVDAEFLAEIMERNERLTIGDDLSTHELEEIRTNIRKLINDLLEVLASAFRNDDLEATKRTLGKLKYYNNIDYKIKSLEMERGVTH